MDRSLLDRAASRGMIGALGGVVLVIVVIWWCFAFSVPLIRLYGGEMFTPAIWISEVATGRSVADLLFGVLFWLTVMIPVAVLPGGALVLATLRMVRRIRRLLRLRRFDPAVPADLVLVRDDGGALTSHLSGRPLRVVLSGTLEHLVESSALAGALSGRTRVALLGDLVEMPAQVSRRVDGYLLNPRSRSSAVIVVDRDAGRCWLMGRIVPQSALIADRSAPSLHPHRARAGGALIAGGGVPLVWAEDAGVWSGSEGGWGDGGSDGGTGGDGGGDGGGGGGDGGGGDGGGGGGGGGGE